MNKQQLKDWFHNLKTWKQGDNRAPHKPLLILWTLGKYLSGESRLISYEAMESEFIDLFIDYGSPSKPRPEYPFIRLKPNKKVGVKDGWEITDEEKIQLNKSGDARPGQLKELGIQAGFDQESFNILIGDREFTIGEARELAKAHFGDSLQEDILKAVGLDAGDPGSLKRDPKFREAILVAYEYRCAVCDYGLRMGRRIVALEAAHIMWHQAGGPDIIPNGFALCSLHHKLFDCGAFTISKDSRFLASEKIVGNFGLTEHIMRYHGKDVRRPINRDYFPCRDYTEWHREQVFKEPQREVC